MVVFLWRTNPTLDIAGHSIRTVGCLELDQTNSIAETNSAQKCILILLTGKPQTTTEPRDPSERNILLCLTDET
jgi:hypothetical protein